MKSKITALFTSLSSLLLSCLGTACGPICFLSGCCGGTAILGFIGLSGSSLSFLNKLTPFFLALTVLSLGFAFYNAYKPKQKTCCESNNNNTQECCSTKEKISFFKSKTFLWIITIMCIVLWSFPLFNKNYQAVSKNNVCCPASDTAGNSCCPSTKDSTKTHQIKPKSCCPSE